MSHDTELQDILKVSDMRISTLETRDLPVVNRYSPDRRLDYVRRTQVSGRNVTPTAAKVKFDYFLDQVISHLPNYEINDNPPNFRAIVKNVRQSALYRNDIDTLLEKIEKRGFMTDIIEKVWNASAREHIPVELGDLNDFMGCLDIMITTATKLKFDYFLDQVITHRPRHEMSGNPLNFRVSWKSEFFQKPTGLA